MEIVFLYISYCIIDLLIIEKVKSQATLPSSIRINDKVFYEGSKIIEIVLKALKLECLGSKTFNKRNC